jgi:hypothetical protein
MYTGEMEPETKTVEPPKTPEYIEVANGVPAGPGGPVMGAPVSRSAWSTGLFSCLGSQDEFCSSDLEVCIVGTFIPCVLYGGNMERILPRRSSFGIHCLSYTQNALALRARVRGTGKASAPISRPSISAVALSGVLTLAYDLGSWTVTTDLRRPQKPPPSGTPARFRPSRKNCQLRTAYGRVWAAASYGPRPVRS